MKNIEEIKLAIRDYPQAAQECVLTLAEFCNARCDGSEQRMAAQFNEKYRYSKDWYYQLFSGRRFNRKLGKLQVDMAKLAQLADDAKKIAEGGTVGGAIPHVETDTVREMRDAIDSIRPETNVCKWLMACGTTGAQKTYAAKYYALTHPDVYYLESPTVPSVCELSMIIGEVVPSCRDGFSGARLRREIVKNVKPKNCFIFDNAQRMYDPRKKLNQQLFGFLQAMQDSTRCAIVLIFVDEATGENSLRRVLFGKDAGYFEQLVGRAGGEDSILFLPDVPSDSDLNAFAKATGFKDPALRRAMLPVLRRLSRQKGRLRVALNTLQTAARLAIAAGREITADDFIDALPGGAELEKCVENFRKALPCA
mgnify:FL=1